MRADFSPPCLLKKKDNMGLFDKQLADIREFLADKNSEGKVREFRAGDGLSWPLRSGIVLEEDTAFELGNPALASLSFIVWTESSAVDDGLITLVGPDISRVTDKSVPFAQVLMVGGTFSDEYDNFRDIRDAVYETHLDGFMVRTLPSRQSIWCRVARNAVDAGFSLSNLGSALIAGLREVDSVEAAEALFVTSSAEDVRLLSSAGKSTQRIVDAMMKMYQEQNFDCSSCEYRDVCESVMELKAIRDRLSGTQSNA